MIASEPITHRPLEAADGPLDSMVAGDRDGRPVAFARWLLRPVPAARPPVQSPQPRTILLGARNAPICYRPGGSVRITHPTNRTD
jgi:hypothetical protein